MSAPEQSALERFVEPLWGKMLVLCIGVLVPVSGQILLKIGTQQTGQLDLSKGIGGLLLTIFTNPYILFGVIFFGLGLLMYLTLISVMDISLVYPAGALAYVLVTAASALELFGMAHEPLNLIRVLGLCAIIGGVVLIAISSETQKKVPDLTQEGDP